MIETGLSNTSLYIIKALLLVITTFLFIIVVHSYKKHNRKKLWITFPFFIVICIFTSLSFALRIYSKEDMIELNKIKKATFEQGEQIIASIELFYKEKNKLPLKLDELLIINPGLKFIDHWGQPFIYKSDGITYRLSFKLANDKGYYFYNSATGSNRVQGYLFKYMHSDLIR